MTTNLWLSGAVYPSLALLPALITELHIHPGIVLTRKDEAAFYEPFPSATLSPAIPTGSLLSLDPVFLPLKPVCVFGSSAMEILLTVCI